MLSKLISHFGIVSGMVISGLVIPGQNIPILLLGLFAGFLTLNLSMLVAKPEPAPRPAAAAGALGGPRFLYGLFLFLFAGSAFMFWELWRGWPSLEGHVVLASTALYLPAALAGLALGMAVNTSKMISS